ncbi:MAG: GtrA family protein [Thiohalocapsa sp. PB-PSB1]|jgi:dolichol-phosphate mannosyltransferase|nr:MAG: GtrA family protein [Thiohalocapsa sp. PB-PSB1]
MNKATGTTDFAGSNVMESMLLKCPAWLPTRFVMFGLVGLSGVVVQVLVLGGLHRIAGVNFLWAQVLSVWVAMTTNFVLNNRLTFGDRSLVGASFFRGLLSFYAACTLGAIFNVLAAEGVYAMGQHWAVAGAVGAVVGSISNYLSTSRLIWRKTSGNQNE